MSALRIVMVVSRYPPHHEAAAERRAADLARELARRGHAVRVLTSAAATAPKRSEDGTVQVLRVLATGDDATRGLGSIGTDCRRLRAELRSADLLVLSHFTGLSAALLAVAQDFGHVCFDVASDWLAVVGSPHHPWYERWRPPADGGRLGYQMKRASAEKLLGIPVRPVQVPFGRSWFWSRERWKRCLGVGLGVHASKVLEPGIDVRLFGYRPQPIPDGPVRALFVDSIERAAGLHTAVLALGDLPGRVRLRIAGPVADEGYLFEAAELGRAAGSVDRIEIAAPITGAEMPAALAEADVLVFPREVPQRFPRRVLEAFSVGTPVIAALDDGASSEVLVDGKTALTFAPGNAPQLARRLATLLGDGGLKDRLVATARRHVEAHFALAYSVDQIEPEIRAAAERGSGA